MSGRVCWVLPAAADGWSFGCKFTPPIPVDVLDEFARAGILDRREHRRAPLSLSTNARWESRDASTSLRIIDCSPGGFCLASPVGGKPGERPLLEVKLDDDHKATVRGKIRWQMEFRDAFVIGCEYVDLQDFNVLSTLAKPMMAAPADEPRRPVDDGLGPPLRTNFPWSWPRPPGRFRFPRGRE